MRLGPSRRPSPLFGFCCSVSSTQQFFVGGSVSVTFRRPNRLTDMGSIDADEFERHRSHLFALAYRMLGSASEAETSFRMRLRSSSAEMIDVRSPRAYLMTVVTRLALDRLKSAHAT